MDLENPNSSAWFSEDETIFVNLHEVIFMRWHETRDHAVIQFRGEKEAREFHLPEPDYDSLCAALRTYHTKR